MNSAATENVGHCKKVSVRQAQHEQIKATHGLLVYYFIRGDVNLRLTVASLAYELMSV